MDLYEKYLRSGRVAKPSIIGQFPTTQTTTTLVSAIDSNRTIYVQKIVVYISTSAAQTITFQDSVNGNIVAQVPASPGAQTLWTFDLGAKGTPLAKGSNLQMAFSGTGNGGTVFIQQYQTPMVVSITYPLAP